VIEIVDPGRHLSVQDLGRSGLERFGIPRGGAADWFSARAANRLLGNPDDAALLEYTGVGPTLMFYDGAIVAITGAGCDGLDGWTAGAAWRAHAVSGHTMLALGRLSPGFRGYLAISGGIGTPLVLGSRSLCDRGHFGGGYGRPLRHGDPLPIGSTVRDLPPRAIWPPAHRLPLQAPWELRVIAGPHGDAFAANALVDLEAIACVITPAVDRMGLRIETPGLRLRAEEILTTPVTAGAIQVTPSGQLIALLVDHPTTGGYPVIATVITADIPLLAQAKPGDTIRFRLVDQRVAASALRRLTDWLDDF
jgi:biotin-dependent carboxylase-like uncharacterized protein